MAKNKRRSGREHDQLQTLKNENRALKRQIASLRKQLARTDIDQYENLKTLVEKEKKNKNKKDIISDLEKEAKRWECWECKAGVLTRIPVFRRDGEFFFRICSNCKNRTRLKKATKNHEKGITKEELDKLNEKPKS